MREHRTSGHPDTLGNSLNGPLIIVEIGQAYEGSETFAHAHIDAVAETGADAVKFQLHIADAESSAEDFFRNTGTVRRESRFEYWRRHELSPEVMGDLVSHARDRGLRIGFSTFSLEGLERVAEAKPDFLKIGSGEAIQKWFLEAAAKMDLPIVLSTGLSTLAEIREAVGVIKRSEKSLTLLQCVTSYPSSLNEIGLNVLAELRDRFAVDVGLSDHSGQLGPAVFAIAGGASMVEVHGTFSKKAQGPDSEASLDFEDIARLVELRNAWLTINRNPIDKDLLADELLPMRQAFGRSLAAKRILDPGDELRAEDLYFAKPGGGLPPEALHTVVGKSLARRVQANSLLAAEDIV